MKKLSILLIGLLLITGFAVAQEFDGSVSVGGSGTVTFGVDLDSQLHGFLNEFTSTLEITLVAEGSVEAGAEDALAGHILIDAFSATADDAAGLTVTAGAVTAKIIISPVEIVIYAAPAMSWGNATVLETGDTDIAPALASDEIVAAAIGGITIVLPIDPATIEVYVVSDGDWTTNSDGDYAAGADVEVVIDPITVSLGGFYGWFDAAGTWGGTAGVVVDLADILNGITVDIGVDLIDPGDFEVDAITTVNLSEANADDEMANVALSIFYSQAADLDVVLGVSEPLAGGLMDMLAAGITLELFDLLSGTIVWNVDVTGSYDAGGLVPGFGVGMGSDNVIDINVYVEIGSDFSGIDHTTVTIDYTTADVNVSNGVVTVETTVSY
jgi:hypothetical protein